MGWGGDDRPAESIELVDAGQLGCPLRRAVRAPEAGSFRGVAQAVAPAGPEGEGARVGRGRGEREGAGAGAVATPEPAPLGRPAAVEVEDVGRQCNLEPLGT